MTSQHTEKLMEHRDDVNYQGDVLPRIPLHLLLEHASDVDYSAKIGEVPLHSVTNTENVTNLLQHGDDISCWNNCHSHHRLYDITDPSHTIHGKFTQSWIQTGYMYVLG